MDEHHASEYYPDYEAQKLDRVGQLIKKIQGRVRDRTLRDSPCAKVAWAVVEGTLPPDELGRILNRIDKIRDSLGSPGAYFIRAAKQQFKERGIAWMR